MPLGRRIYKKRMPFSNRADRGSKFALNREVADLYIMLILENDILVGLLSHIR